MKSHRFVYVWRYVVDSGRRSEFHDNYGPNGTWARLFSRESGYIRTELMRDDNDENVYLTVDYWVSKADRDLFRKRYAREFDELDSACEAFTLEEEFIGDFSTI